MFADYGNDFVTCQAVYGDYFVTIGDRLKEERERLGYNQTDFAALGSTTKKSQIDYEKNTTQPKAGYLVAIACIGVDVTYVLTGVRLDEQIRQNIDHMLRFTAAQDPTGMSESARLAVEAARETGVEVRARMAEEQELLNLFRTASPAGRAAAIGALRGVAQTSSKIHVGTNKGQVIEGGLTQEGPVIFGGKYKERK
jgi:transcriptional regulator with XRE-family HTH domain